MGTETVATSTSLPAERPAVPLVAAAAALVLLVLLFLLLGPPAIVLVGCI